MNGEFLDYEPAIRLTAFAGIFLAMAMWELVLPRRRQQLVRRRRWPGNLALLAVDTLAVRLVFPLAAVGVALAAEERGWGLFNQADAPSWLMVVSTVLALDLLIYFQHRLFHAVPWLWRLHRMHHADLEFDVTTGIRFHPFEILISMGIKSAAVIALGAAPLGVLIFEVLLNASSMFNHGNAYLPLRTDARLRWLVVTPDMHRVHHSILRRETDSNFGFNLPWWDRLFGTYRDQPEAGHLDMTIGIEDFREPGDLRLDRMLLQPFKGPSRRTLFAGSAGAGHPR